MNRRKLTFTKMKEYSHPSTSRRRRDAFWYLKNDGSFALNTKMKDDFLCGSLELKRSLLEQGKIDLNAYETDCVPLYVSMLFIDEYIKYKDGGSIFMSGTYTETITKAHLELCDAFDIDYTFKYRGETYDAIWYIYDSWMQVGYESHMSVGAFKHIVTNLEIIANFFLSKPKFDPMLTLIHVEKRLEYEYTYKDNRRMLQKLKGRVINTIIMRCKEICAILRPIPALKDVLSDIIFRSVFPHEQPPPKLKASIMRMLNKA